MAARAFISPAIIERPFPRCGVCFVTNAELLAGISTLRALVVGDVCLDRWCYYDPALSEASRETGIPRTAVTSTEITPGAAGTVANNLASLGVAGVTVLGVTGEDGFGVELERALDRRGITAELIPSPDVTTFTYTKLINKITGAEDLPRVDFVNDRPLDTSLEDSLIGRLRKLAKGFNLLLVSDQAETSAGGVITARVREELAAISRERLVWVDSRSRVELFSGNVLLKCNHEEAEAASRRALGRIDLAGLRRHINVPLLTVTHGPRGSQLISTSSEDWVPARAVDHPVDICGAGDSYSAGAALAQSLTGSAIEGARFGHLVASITIMKKGTGTASPDEILGSA
jgi:rfaE bifunctional protein kinase chain/domain